MIVLKGCAALSEFRRTKLLENLRTVAPSIRQLQARYVHFADVSQALETAEQNVLERLLSYGPAASPEDPAARLVLVVPRPGTISPWFTR